MGILRLPFLTQAFYTRLFYHFPAPSSPIIHRSIVCRVSIYNGRLIYRQSGQTDSRSIGSVDSLAESVRFAGRREFGHLSLLVRRVNGQQRRERSEVRRIVLVVPRPVDPLIADRLVVKPKRTNEK